MRNKQYIFCIFIIIIFLGIVALFAYKKAYFYPVADNITHLMGAESLYYDTDLKVENNDYERLITKYNYYAETTKDLIGDYYIGSIAVISKPNAQSSYYVAKPIFYLSYLALFTPITDLLLRAILSNILLLLAILGIILYILMTHLEKKQFSLLVIIIPIFLVALLGSQLLFYIPLFHPEIFINLIVILSTVPLLLAKKTHTYIYVVSGIAGALLLSEKQIALFFPLVTMIFIFFTNRNALKYYVGGFVVGVLLITLLYQSIYQTFTPYDGPRGLIRYSDTDGIYFTKSNVKLVSFPFPMSYIDRFYEYFLGKNIGIFVYGPLSIIFLLYTGYFVVKRQWLHVVFFLPVLLYIGVYFFSVTPKTSYGGSTAIGNRYFFQVYLYVLLVVAIYVTKFISGFSYPHLKIKNGKIVIGNILAIVFFITISLLVYRPFYRNYARAIRDHVFIPENSKIFSFFPIELTYSQQIYNGLHTVNVFNNYIVINNGYRVIEEEHKRGITENKSNVIEISPDGNFRLDTRDEFTKVRSYRLNFLFEESVYFGLYEVHCKDSNQEVCVYLSSEE
ncbi:MAG TPA: hypothetical protein PLS49_02435 [Candidatus Woesebacteria bacterium]|nr:hypothetical protein [Candidatus Woesebacteria bacterium]